MNKRNLSRFISMAGVLAVGITMLSCSDEKKRGKASESGKGSVQQDAKYTENGEQIIDLALAGANPDEYSAAVNRFNRQYEGQYKVVMRQIENTEISKDFSQALNMEIVSGNTPDIVCSYDYSIFQNLAGKGGLADMYPLIDSENSPLSREDFFSNFLTANEVNGRLIAMPTGFCVSTAVAKQKNVPGMGENWSIEDFLSVYASLPDDVFITTGASDPNTLLFDLVYRNISRYIDYTTGECTFDGEEFTSLIEASKELTKKGDYEYEFAPEAYAADKAIVCFVVLHSEEDFDVIKESEFGNEEIVFVGIPTNDGKGGGFSFMNTFGIIEGSDCKEASWLFVEEILGDEHYEDISQQVFSPLEKNLNIENEQLDTYLRSITDSAFYDIDIMDIIQEEAAYYYNGERTAQECTEIINNRVSLIIAEQTWAVE